jgi:hypothetical protein
VKLLTEQAAKAERSRSRLVAELKAARAAEQGAQQQLQHLEQHLAQQHQEAGRQVRQLQQQLAQQQGGFQQLAAQLAAASSSAGAGSGSQVRGPASGLSWRSPAVLHMQGCCRCWQLPRMLWACVHAHLGRGAEGCWPGPCRASCCCLPLQLALDGTLACGLG